MNNLELLNKRLQWQGGNQEQRMIKEKFRTFQDALNYSQQGSNIQKVQSFNSCAQLSLTPIHRALINPNKLTQDYDNKVLAVDNSLNYQVGDVIKWTDTNTYWLLYLNSLTEEAYYRCEMRRCKYKLKFKNKQGSVLETWIALIGPSEKNISFSEFDGVNVDSPNYSLKILMPKNTDTTEMFQRYSEFLFQGKCWQIQAVDNFSTQNILEIDALEHYIDRDTDDVVNEVKNGLVIEPITPEKSGEIEGNQLIQIKLSETYSVTIPNGHWQISNWTEDPPLDESYVSYNVYDDNKKITLKWIYKKPGRFKLTWKSADNTITYFKNIRVDSLF